MLDREPGSSRTGPTEPLTPYGDRISGVGDVDLAVVAIDLEEPGGGLGPRSRCRIAQLDGRSPGFPTVRWPLGSVVTLIWPTLKSLLQPPTMHASPNGTLSGS
jgi:hypothetical protein